MKFKNLFTIGLLALATTQSIFALSDGDIIKITANGVTFNPTIRLAESASHATDNVIRYGDTVYLQRSSASNQYWSIGSDANYIVDRFNTTQNDRTLFIILQDGKIPTNNTKVNVVKNADGTITTLVGKAVALNDTKVNFLAAKVAGACYLSSQGTANGSTLQTNRSAQQSWEQFTLAEN